ncbi:DUF1212-domain-containing protein [Auricularia subglabra TFB-10046 SS5]|nr:DUF1212-domain-containing protein [Auricularia subglabra TFB-10046 SS5]
MQRSPFPPNLSPAIDSFGSRTYLTEQRPHLERKRTLHNRCTDSRGHKIVIEDEEARVQKLRAAKRSSSVRSRFNLFAREKEADPFDANDGAQRPPGPKRSNTEMMEEGQAPERPTLSRQVTQTFARLGNRVANMGQSGDDDSAEHAGDAAGHDEPPRANIGLGFDTLRQQATNWMRMPRRGMSTGEIVKHKASFKARQGFVLKLAKGLLYFGAPSHRIEQQLHSVARVLDISAQFVYLPSLVLISFGDEEHRTSEVLAVRSPTKLALGKLQLLHDVYRGVVHDELNAEEGTEAIAKLLKSPPQYSAHFRLVLAFACSAIICPMSFGGSFLDMWMSGLGGVLLCFLQHSVIVKHPMYASVFELSVALIMSFFARALSEIPGNLFCYSAISSGSIVLILPGFIILCSALELGSKNIVCGSVRMVYAIMYALFLGFGLTIGSDLYYILDPAARRAQHQAIAAQRPIHINGTFNSDSSMALMLTGSFSFARAAVKGTAHGHGCMRQPDSQWYLRPFPFWTLFFLVPTYCLFSSLWKGQPFRNRHLPIMVLFACCSYTANRVAKQFIQDRGDVTSAVGAFVLGILGNTYSRCFNGTAFTVMITGVTFLVPSTLGYGGGLSFSGDLYTQGILLGLRMVQVAIGVTIGLFTSALVVYSFGTTKRSGMFGF